MELWQRFTHRARRCILIAHDEASRSHQHLIGTEHILLGLTRLGEGLAADILRHLGVDLEALRDDVSAMAPAGEELRPSNQIAFTPEAQRVLQLAYGQAQEMGDHHIGTEHILLGLAREGSGAAYRALGRHSVDAARVRQTVDELVAEGADHPADRGATTGRAEQVALAARELLRRAHAAAADMRRHLEKAEDLLEQIADLVVTDSEETGSETMDRQTLSSDRIPPAVGPYSQAVRAGEMLFCSGVIGLDPESRALVEDSFEAQVRQVMDNLGKLLEDCGSGFDRVVKTTVFLTDMEQFAAFNQIYAEYFDEAPPARSTVQVAALPLGAQIEVEAIAIA